MKNVAKLLIIAGSDPSGGAGIQADIKAATKNKVYAAAAITSLTAQNTQSVEDVFDLDPLFLRKQIMAVLKDIKFDAVKTGMLSNSKTINIVYELFCKYCKNVPLIVDPVMVSTSGHRLLEEKAVNILKKTLVKIAYITTPNVDEAEILSKTKINNIQDMKKAALIIKKIGSKNVLIKGGHIDIKGKIIRSLLLDENNNFHIISNKRIDVGNIHGTGCSLASAIAANIAKKNNILKSVKSANSYIFRSAKNNIAVGCGSRVLRHF